MRNDTLLKFILSISLITFGSSSLLANDKTSIENAISIGLINNYDIRIEKAAKEQKDNNIVLATGYLLPQVSISSGVQLQNKDDLLEVPSTNPASGDNSSTIYSASANASWTLFDGFRMFYARELVYDQANQANYSNIAKIESTVLSIIEAYYAIVSNKSALQIIENNYTISEKRFEKAKVGNTLGSISKRELYSAEVAYNSDKSNLEDAKFKLIQSKYQLNNLLGRDIGTEFDVDDEIIISEINNSRDELYQICLEKNADVKSLHVSKAIAEKMLGISKSKYYPMIIAQASYGYNNNNMSYETIDVETEALTGSVGLSLNWNIFNGFADRADIKNKNLDIEKIDISKEALLSQLKISIYSKYLDYENSLKKLEYNKLAVEAATKNMEVSKELFNNGSITDVQFRQTQTELLNSNYALIGTKFKIVSLKAQLEKLAGTIKID